MLGVNSSVKEKMIDFKELILGLLKLLGAKKFEAQ